MGYRMIVWFLSVLLITLAQGDFLEDKLNAVSTQGANVLGHGYNLVYGNPHLITLSNDQTGSDPGYAGDIFQFTRNDDGVFADQIEFTSYGTCKGEVYREIIPGMASYRNLLLANVFHEYQEGEECRRTRFGQEYKGNLSVTASGNACLSWDVAKNTLDRAGIYPERIEEMANFCRNPGYQKRLWCYVAPRSRKNPEHCDVPYCTPKITSQSLRESAFMGQAKDSYNPRPDLVHYEIRSTCKLGRASFDLDTASFTTGFVQNSCRLPSTYDQGPYMEHIDIFGTHVITAAELGVAHVERMFATRAHLAEALRKDNKLYPYKVNDTEYFAYPIADITERTLTQSLNRKTGLKLTLGYYNIDGKGNGNVILRPVNHKLLPLEDIFDLPAWQTACATATGCCEKTPSLKANLLKALAEYADYKNIPRVAEDSDSAHVGVLATWPSGSFALPFPGKKTGPCPAGDFVKSEMSLTHIYNPGPSFGQVLKAQILGATRFGFMSKRSANELYNVQEDKWHVRVCLHSTEKDQGRAWPDGNYCLLRVGGACLPGFAEGRVTWNDNRKLRLTGTYHTDHHTSKKGKTTLNTCCKNTKPPKDGMLLPTARPFFLIKNGRSCPRVKGMDVKSIISRSSCSDETCMEVNKYEGAMARNEVPHLKYPALCKYTPSEGKVRKGLFKDRGFGYNSKYDISGHFPTFAITTELLDALENLTVSLGLLG